MPSAEALEPASFAAQAKGLLEAISQAKRGIEEVPGVLDGTLDRFRDRIDRLIRESKVDNWRQVRIFLRDVDTIAVDLAKASKEKRLSPKHLAVFDLTLRKAKKRDFYGARKAWRKLDRVADQAAEVRRLQSEYQEKYRALEGRIRTLRADVDRLACVPSPAASVGDARDFVAKIEAFSAEAETAYLDFLSRAPAHRAIPMLLNVAQRGGIGVPAPPQGSDPEPLLVLLAETPADGPLSTRSFYGLMELPTYSDAKLTHTLGDARKVRTALDAAWAWLKAVRDLDRRSLQVPWTDDPTLLRRRLPALVKFLAEIGAPADVLGRAEAVVGLLSSGQFDRLQTSARLYASHGKDAERKWAGDLEKDIQAMTREAAALAGTLKKFPVPERPG